MRKKYIKRAESVDRQKLLNQRLEKVMVVDENRKPQYKLYKDIGVSLSTLNSFMNMSRMTSLVQLSMIEKYIIEKEKELGL
jgi:hypothetical protein